MIFCTKVQVSDWPRRRQKPGYFSQGLSQGMSHFGMSMLGSIAGLVDHPMNAVVAELNSNENRPVLLRTSNIAIAASKGLIGTKNSLGLFFFDIN